MLFKDLARSTDGKITEKYFFSENLDFSQAVDFSFFRDQPVLRYLNILFKDLTYRISKFQFLLFPSHSFSRSWSPFIVFP